MQHANATQQKTPGGNGGSSQNQYAHTATLAQRSEAPVTPQAALRVVRAQADEVQTLAREIIQEAYTFAPFHIVQKAARVVAVCGLLAERISEVEHANH